MVLESIIDPRGAKRHPVWLFFIGIFFAVLSILFGVWIFKDQASMVMVFLTVLLSLPLMYATIEEEEEEDWEIDDERTLLEEHSKAIIFLSAMFFGFVVGYTLIYILLPAPIVENVFSVQTATINAINNVPATGNAFVDSGGAFFKILGNNFKVLIFSIFFAFFFGAGAIFILAWNGSIIATAIGNYIRNGLAESASALGLTGTAVYLHLFALGILRYMIHGIFEVVGYFMGALAGGIISMGIVNHGFQSERFKNILYDALILVLIAFVLLIVGAVVEVYVTPLLF